MADQRLPDAVDAILAQWQRERPDLDTSPMGTIGRVKRCAALLQRRLDETFAEFGLSAWEFDMLATLRRSGAPYCLAPTTLFSTLMVTSGTMTHRMGKLEASGWIARLPNSADARSSLVQLTAEGLALIDRAVEAHVVNEHRILAPLKAAELAALNARLSQLLIALEPPSATDSNSRPAVPWRDAS
ncbi:MarR family transcriptional regulator [Acidovorax sp.]|uniref:MarR family winged helix-turn-helix transcriptional regulator n=1 Tax=Acidovorax sp. TaxID=1872122 RepID=UPI00261D95FB|nr:MarR family transcriptional regulator [Acidovorax sp.]